MLHRGKKIRERRGKSWIFNSVLLDFIYYRKSHNKHCCARAKAGKTLFDLFTKARSILPGFSYWQMKDDDKKMFTPQLGTDTVSNFFIPGLGARRNSQKIFAHLPFKKTFRMRLVLAGSNSLDSTVPFQEVNFCSGTANWSKIWPYNWPTVNNIVNFLMKCLSSRVGHIIDWGTRSGFKTFWKADCGTRSGIKFLDPQLWPGDWPPGPGGWRPPWRASSWGHRKGRPFSYQGMRSRRSSHAPGKPSENT